MSSLREKGAQTLLEVKGKGVLEVMGVFSNDACSLEIKGRVEEVGKDDFDSPLSLCTIIP